MENPNPDELVAALRQLALVVRQGGQKRHRGIETHHLLTTGRTRK